ncbi:sugar transporter ERD6-like 5 isoform X5 [Salvia hispanica]|uniref:sugar transporter ERD6-like 5 isoform X5 n=1 Tax=Salvia hispanica TaxID=49212 RepID=UPI0020096816|nr:sugar transporter ERD6-like 5 isoform X5 [Salvia hispanica]
MESVSTTTPLLPEISPEVADNSATAILVLSTVVAVAGSYAFGSAVGFSSPAQPGIVDDLGLTVAENAWWLDIGRVLTGFGIGILSYVVPVYIAEITPKDLRGGFTAANQLLICCGTSITYLVGNILPWRLLALTGIIPCLVQLIGLFFIPESPRWLAKIGRWDGSKASLVCLRGKNANIFDEAAEIRDHTRTPEQVKDFGLVDLFQRKYAHSLIVGVGLMALQQFGGVNAIAYYASAIFSSAGFSYKVGTTAMAILQIPMTILGTLLIDKSGRRPLLLSLILQVSAAGTCLGCFSIGLSFLLQDFKLWDFSPFLALGGVLIFKGSFALGMGAIPWVIMSEIFPIHAKGLAGSLVNLVNWFGSWIVTYSFNFVAQWSSAGTFFVFASVCGLTMVFITKLVPETNGRTLEEIQVSIIS